MDQTPTTSSPDNQIELRLKELIQLILPLHALLEGGYDETTGRLEEVIDALAAIAYTMQKTAKIMNEERNTLSPALDLRLKAITQKQDLQMQMLTDLHSWLGAPQRQTAAPASLGI